MKSLILSGVAALSLVLLLFVSPLEAAVVVISGSVNSTAQNGFGVLNSVSTPIPSAPPSGTTTATVSPVVATTEHIFTQSPNPTSLAGDLTLDTGTVIGGIAKSSGTMNFSVDVNSPYEIEGMFHYTSPLIHGGLINVYLRPYGGGTPLFDQLINMNLAPDMVQLSSAGLTGSLSPGSYEFSWAVSASNGISQQVTHADAHVSITVGVPERASAVLLMAGAPLAFWQRRRSVRSRHWAAPTIVTIGQGPDFYGPGDFRKVCFYSVISSQSPSRLGANSCPPPPSFRPPRLPLLTAGTPRMPTPP